MVFDAKFFVPGFYVAIDDVEFASEANLPVPAEGSCDATGWSVVTTAAPSITSPPLSTTPPTVITTTMDPTTPGPILVIPPLAEDETKKVSCNFEYSSYEERACGWKPAFNDGSEFDIGIPPSVEGSTIALFAVSGDEYHTYTEVSKSIQGNGEARRLQVIIY